MYYVRFLAFLRGFRVGTSRKVKYLVACSCLCPYSLFIRFRSTGSRKQFWRTYTRRQRIKLYYWKHIFANEGFWTSPPGSISENNAEANRVQCFVIMLTATDLTWFGFLKDVWYWKNSEIRQGVNLSWATDVIHRTAKGSGTNKSACTKPTLFRKYKWALWLQLWIYQMKTAV